ncbi:PDZ domain-containing protein [Bremerella cremea]|uniref:PDZ domain-containing protein n=1 Tax=Bremerella cremea TaxID=1031537 RepID=A0A368KXH8_9BACT|nr:PDZ domain-containing protein [Bremerella cremea]RCS55953.1 PDZ domain-containing protein [Bremerella cremea]
MLKPLTRLPLLLLTISLTLACGSVGAQQLNIEEDAAIRAAVELAAPSVVQIETVGGLVQGGGPLEGGSRTTGTIISADGYILSSLVGFIQEPSGILVTLPSGKRVAAKVVAKDKNRNLILLKVETDEELPTPKTIERSQLRPGQWAIALGKTFSPDMPSVSVGILSAKNRVWGKAVQTDAKISPNNYGGPLVDIHGRVIGILTPLSPQDSGATGGMEWYDSGIGFAVPLTELEPRLALLKEGKDLLPGLLGINLKGNDIIADPAEIAAVRYNSPAQEAGIQAKDILIEANGHPIERQAQLKHILGEAYAGDTIAFKVKRGDEELSLEVKLADKLIPYDRPLLGIMPQRDIEEAIVQYVFEDTAAHGIGLQAGDKVIRYDDTEITTSQSLREAVATAKPDVPHKLTIVREGAEQAFEVQPRSFPNQFLTGAPQPTVAPDAAEQEGLVTGESDFQLAEEQNEAKLFVPEVAKKLPSLGLVVVLGDVDFKLEPMRDAWHEQAEAFGFAVLEVMPANGDRWNRAESSVVRKMIDRVRDNYNIDAKRTITVGGKSGGAMSLIHGFENRDVQNGAVSAEAGIPRGTSVPDCEPLSQLELVFVIPREEKRAEVIKKQASSLREMKYTVIELPMPDEESSVLSATEIAQLAVWLNTLDRI